MDASPPSYQVATTHRFNLLEPYVTAIRSRAMRFTSTPEQPGLLIYYKLMKRQLLVSEPRVLQPNSMKNCYLEYCARAWKKIRLIAPSAREGEWTLEKLMVRLIRSIRIAILLHSVYHLTGSDMCFNPSSPDSEAAALRARPDATSFWHDIVWDRASPPWHLPNGPDIYDVIELHAGDRTLSPADWVNNLLQFNLKNIFYVVDRFQPEPLLRARHSTRRLHSLGKDETSSRVRDRQAENYSDEESD